MGVCAVVLKSSGESEKWGKQSQSYDKVDGGRTLSDEVWLYARVVDATQTSYGWARWSMTPRQSTLLCRDGKGSGGGVCNMHKSYAEPKGRIEWSALQPVVKACEGLGHRSWWEGTGASLNAFKGPTTRTSWLSLYYL